MGLGTPEILIIAGIIVLLFGASAIPKFARSIGKAKREFEEGLRDGNKQEDDEDKKTSAEKSTTKEREL